MLTVIVRHLRSYGVAYFLVALHFSEATSAVAISVSCAWIFVHFVRRKYVDLYLIFVLLTPSIVFLTADPGAQDLGTAPGIFDHFNSVFFVGPVALSTRLCFSFAILARVLIRFRQVRLRFLTTGWLAAVALASLGLVYSVIAGNSSSAGLTVGLRIALSVGAVLVPCCVRNRREFVEGLDKILVLSMLLLVLGLTNGHWLFIAVGLIFYAFMRFRPRILALLPLAYAIKIVALPSSTLTVVGIILASLSFFILLVTNRLTNHLLRRKLIMIAGLALPIVLTIYVLRLPTQDRFDLTDIQGFATFKLLGDRKPIWDASFDQIVHSSALVVPAGSVLDVYFTALRQPREWAAGSHNIFLETGRQIGALGMIFLAVIMIAMLYKTGRRMRTTEEFVLFYCFLSIYIVFGITGNSLVYDGVGALYWFLVGQLYQTTLVASESRPRQLAVAVPFASGQLRCAST